ncbi:MAG TPA: IclR family transcriptional regulator [Planctomycetota bacterium]|nr:IclR family transcriptional regulator [Planctomycetota bacterium]
MLEAVRKALKVLEAVAARPEAPTPLGTLADSAGLNPATCAHILASLVEAGYVEQAGRKQGYTLGPAAYALSAHGAYRRDLVRLAEPVMAGLAGSLGETVLLAALRGVRRLVLHEVEGGGLVRVRAEALRGDDPCETATGRVLLAALSGEELAAFLKAAGAPGRRWPEAATAAKLSEELARIRQAGHAVVDRGEVTGLAFPVSRGGRVVAALGLFLPTYRFTAARRPQLLAALGEAAQAIGAKCQGLAVDRARARLETKEKRS